MLVTARNLAGTLAVLFFFALPTEAASYGGKYFLSALLFFRNSV